MEGGRLARAERVDTGALYDRTRRELSAVVRELRADELETRVPATPAWTVRDVLAHVVGLSADLNAQRFPAPDDDGTVWTGAQVRRGRDHTVTELLDQWDREGPVFEDGLRAFGYEMGSHFVADLHAHHQDVRGALRMPRDSDPLVVRVALDHYLAFLDGMLAGASWGTLDLVLDGEQQTLGGRGSHVAGVRAQPFEWLRSVSGRRSARQIRALDWDGDADAFIALLRSGLVGGYSLPDADVVE